MFQMYFTKIMEPKRPRFELLYHDGKARVAVYNMLFFLMILQKAYHCIRVRCEFHFFNSVFILCFVQ